MENKILKLITRLEYELTLLKLNRDDLTGVNERINELKTLVSNEEEE